MCAQETSMQIAGIMLNRIRQGKCWKKITARVLSQLDMPPILLVKCSLLQFITSGLQIFKSSWEIIFHGSLAFPCILWGEAMIVFVLDEFSRMFV